MHFVSPTLCQEAFYRLSLNIMFVYGSRQKKQQKCEVLKKVAPFPLFHTSFRWFLASKIRQTKNVRFFTLINLQNDFSWRFTHQILLTPHPP